MELIKSYEQQFGNLTAEATAKISELSRVAREGAPSSEVDGVKRQVYEALNEAREVLEQYELEIREQPQSEKQKLNWRLKSYQNEFKERFEVMKNFFLVFKKRSLFGNLLSFGILYFESRPSITGKTLKNTRKRLEKELSTTSDKLQEIQSRNELLGAAIDISLDTGDNDQEERNLLTAERIERGTNRLRDAQRVAIESEEIGVEILGNLARDRETINRSRSRVRDTEMNLTTSSRLLSSMMRRAVQNRIILFCIIGALAFFIIGMIYFKFK